ncbi:MAG: Plug domain-containing protein, partial [Planctomycetes bacterium]|nr:Plug domain-containing protein [Planctomycetota bacterium]
MRWKMCFFTLPFLLVILVSSGFSQDPSSDTTEDLFDLSLEELMEIEVASTSKTPVSIERAPGTVYLFSGDALWDKGITTLEDLLRQIPGVQLVPSRLGHTSVWIRGVQGRYNSKLLLLVDGVPMRDFFYGNFTVDEMYPMENIEKIEVLLGPGSTLYGSNAFAGVISITTKKKKNEIFGSIGSYDTYSGSAHATYGDAS